MTTQIAVRLPDDVVSFLDGEVAAGRAPSRTSIVLSAIEADMRRRIAERDAEILRTLGAADDLDELVEWTARRPVLED